MLMLPNIHIYTVHIKPDVMQPYEKAEFVREGFSWPAFFFTFFWALYHKLWLVAVGILVVSITLSVSLSMLTIDPVTMWITQIGLQLIIGFQANDWLREGLRKRGYITADIVTGNGMLAAQQRFFDRLFTSPHHPQIA